MLKAELDDHLGYAPYKYTDIENSRDGKKQKKIRSKYGKMNIEVSQDHNNSSFEPKVVKKIQKDISGIDDKIIAMYAKRLTPRQTYNQIEDIYGFEVSEGIVPDITYRLLPEIEAWQNRPL